MTGHPYRTLPDRAFWRRSVARPRPQEVDPTGDISFTISPEDRVATAGSCFAQHIARHLKTAGFQFLVTETAHPIVPHDLAATYNYGLYTARYGNIYTTRQLLQLFQRAFGTFHPRETAWQNTDARWIDPFRPQIQPNGFATLTELETDRERHLACVREAFRSLDVFVFTLGLTESWFSDEDGATYPICPGVDGGRFDERKHRFHNATASEVADDLRSFIDRLREVNPRAKIILTVSPVPLMATASSQHVLTATTYSKAALRVAAEEVCATRPDTAYFPSFEIITGHFNRGAYFAEDCRSVTEQGVEHVMRVFLARHTTGAQTSRPGEPPIPEAVEDSHSRHMKDLVRVVCEEEALDR